MRDHFIPEAVLFVEDGIITGTIDITDPSFSVVVVKAIQEANGNGEVDGPVVTTSMA